MGNLRDLLLYAMVPVVALLVGGTIAAFRPPSERVQSYLQHFAAGVVFAAVAGEILPELTHDRAPIPVIIGFALGVAAMLLIRRFTERFDQAGGTAAESQSTTSSKVVLPVGLIITVGIDLLIDGLLVGVGFAAGTENGILLTIALTLEILFLGLSTAAALTKSGAPPRQVIIITLILAVAVLLGISIGVTLLTGLSGFPLDVVLAFGAAALLYLVTEELLVEAHTVPETALTTTMFFLGFLVLFVIELVV